MSQWKEGFLKAGVVFPFVRFCAPLNSQEKRAEHFNGAKKRALSTGTTSASVDFMLGMKVSDRKQEISDELNDTYEDQEYYTWEQLITEDMMDVREFNNSPHPNQKNTRE